MGQWIRTAKRSQTRTLGVEPLEDRWLPSGFWLFDDPAAMLRQPVAARGEPADDSLVARIGPDLPSAAAEVVEIGQAANVGDIEIVLARSKLPHRIVEALDVAFPGWTQVEAELTTERGVPGYSVRAELNGAPIDVTITENGRISESEQHLLPGQLPPAAREWVRKNFPGAEMSEAVRVTERDGVSFDVQILTTDGRKLEATLRFGDVKTQFVTKNEDPAADARSNVESALVHAARDAHADAMTPILADVAVESQIGEMVGYGSRAHFGVTMARAAHSQTGWLVSEQSAQLDVAVEPDNSPPAQGAPADSVDASTAAALWNRTIAVADVGPLAWLAHIAGAMCDCPPIDAAAVERSLRQLVADLDALTDKLAGDGYGRSIVTGVVLLVGLVAGSPSIIRRSRRFRHEPVLGSISASTSWNWVLGTRTPPGPQLR